MKTILEQEDIKAVASTVVESIAPLLKYNSKEGVGDPIFDVEGLAKYLKVDSSWVYKQTSLKDIPYFKVGKYIRFKKSAIDKWVDGETIKPIPPLKMIKDSR